MTAEILNNVKYTDEYYQNEFNRNENKSAHHKTKINNVFELIGEINKNEKILDIGTCSGTFAFLCAKKGAEVYATDLSQQVIDYCKKKQEREKLNNINFMVASAEKQPFPSDSFDKIIMGDIAEHLPKNIFRETIKECGRLLKKGGKLIIYTPNNKHFFEILRKHNIILKKDETHINLMNMEEILDTLSKNNFKIQKKYYKTSHFPIINIFEKAISMIPKIGQLANRRICILAEK